MKKVLVVYGTRPEAIKVAPLIRALSTSAVLRPVVAVTGQHREMLDQVNALFGIVPDYDLDLIRPRQQLHELTARVLKGVTKVIRDVRPDALLVQGDTTTAMVAALAAFYEQVPVVHLEAGLRTDNRYDPFPEEMNRRITTELVSLHLAPTATSRENLLRQAVDPADIVVTGNTVIDALLDVVSRDLPPENPALAFLAERRRTVLVTAHRRESWGEPMARIATAVAELARSMPDVTFLLPAHLNPAVREVLLPPLAAAPNIVVTEPLSYADFARAMDRSEVLLTDSGGVQEEGPSLGKPVLVLRETTERPEAVTAGTVRLVGTDVHAIVAGVQQLLTSPSAYDAMARTVNPYGDGKASPRAVAAMAQFFGVGEREPDFSTVAPIPAAQPAAALPTSERLPL